MTTKTCPKCGAEIVSPEDSCNFDEFECGTLMSGPEIEWQAPDCIRRQRDALERRIEELEAEIAGLRSTTEAEITDNALATAASALQQTANEREVVNALKRRVRELVRVGDRMEHVLRCNSSASDRVEVSNEWTKTKGPQ